MSFRILCLTLFLSFQTLIAIAKDDETESGDGKLAADAPVGASDEGELAIQGFVKPEGWKISLFAAEPELANPVAMYVDNKGRVFVCESFRQDRGVTDNRKHDQEWLLADLAAETVQDRIDYHKRLLGTEANEYTAHDDRIRLLLDEDKDGVADTAKMFASGFNKLEEGTGAGILVRGDTAYFTCIPKLWMLSDTDGNGEAEKREALQDGYGVRVAFRGHDSHGLIIGPDGRLYFSIGDRGYNIETSDGTIKNTESGAVFRCELDGTNLEVFATGLRNPQELAFDDYGYLFTGDNNSDSGDKARWVNVMEGGDTGWRMMYQYLPDRGPFNRERIWEPYSRDTPAYIVPPIENIADGPSGLTCYPGTGLSGDFANCFFLVDFRGGPSNSGIRLIRTQPKGAFWEVERSEKPIWNILATDADFGPDGRLWVCDWVFGWVGEGKGRIYRVEDEEAQKQDIVREVEKLLNSGFAHRDSKELGRLLRHLDRRIRLESQWELATRGDLAQFQALLDDSTATTISRLHAVWGAAQAARLDRTLLSSAAKIIAQGMRDADLDVRATSAAAVGDLKLNNFANQIVELISDSEPRVQYAACIAAGKLRLSDAIDAVCQMLQTNQDTDPGLRHAGIIALKGAADRNRIHELQKHSSSSVRLAAVVALRKASDPKVAAFLSDESDRVRLEAARAVHDVPELHSQLSQLAATGLGNHPSDALVHRVLNANFRLGDVADVKRIADVAVNSNFSELMRVEAIEMLGSWGSPGKLDRVMNRYSPLEDRSDSAAKNVLASTFGDLLEAPEPIVVAAIKAAKKLKLASAADSLATIASSSEISNDLRLAAIEAMIALKGEASIPQLLSLTEDNSATVRATALKELARIAPNDALPKLQQAVNAKNSIETQYAWDALSNLSDNAIAEKVLSAGLQNYLANELSADVRLNVREAIEKANREAWQSALSDFDQGIQSADSTIAGYEDCLEGGNVDAGESLFYTKTELSCVRCHKVDDEGGEVGPDLSAIALSKDRRYLLEAIVNPDAKIAEKFETIMLLTDDDRIVTGILRSETATTIELINAEGEIIKVDSDFVISRKKGKSAMPADLIKNMSKRELRDLVAFLASLKSAKSDGETP